MHSSFKKNCYLLQQSWVHTDVLILLSKEVKHFLTVLPLMGALLESILIKLLAV